MKPLSRGHMTLVNSGEVVKAPECVHCRQRVYIYRAHDITKEDIRSF